MLKMSLGWTRSRAFVHFPNNHSPSGRRPMLGDEEKGLTEERSRRSLKMLVFVALLC